MFVLFETVETLGAGRWKTQRSANGRYDARVYMSIYIYIYIYVRVCVYIYIYMYGVQGSLG